jgi:anti-anti-sigma factor
MSEPTPVLRMPEPRSAPAPRRSFDVVLPARLDASTVSEVRYSLQIALEATADDLVVDCAAVELIDAAGLGLLVSTHRRCQQFERRLVLADPRPPLLRLLAVTRLRRVLHLDLTRDRPLLAAGD